MRNDLWNHPLFAASAPGAALRSQPLGFVDVGARGGVHELVEPLAAGTAVLGFEPEPTEFARLQQELAASSPYARYVLDPCALAASEGAALLHVMAEPLNSSLRAANPAFVERYDIKTMREVARMPVRTTTLDEVLFGWRAHEPSWGEFLKLDTQGTEYEILLGASRTLAERTVAIFCEVEFFPVHAGQKLFYEVEQLLRGQGFSFYGFARVLHRSCRRLDKRNEIGRERPLWADAVFFKDPLPGGYCTSRLTPRQAHALFACAMLLEYYDFALELALATWAREEEAARITRLVHDRATVLSSQLCHDVQELAERVRTDPTSANLEVGRFVDARRHRGDFNDVLLPKSSAYCRTA